MEAAVLGAVVVFYFFSAAALLRGFVAPNLDFLDFREVAVAFAEGRLPVSFKRGPAFPLAMALAAKVTPGPDPYLSAALALNLAAGVATLLLTYFWARPILKEWAVAAVAWLGAASSFTAQMVAPMCDMFFAAAVLAAVLAARRRPWSYILAGLAAATRYEAVVLVVAVALWDARRRKAWWQAVLYGILAAAPITAWLILSFIRVGPYHPYIGQYLLRHFAARELLAAWAELLFSSRIPAVGMMSWLALALATAGVFFLAWARREDGRHVIAACFFAIYSAAHLVYPWPFARFALPILPFAVVGLWVVVISVVGRLWSRKPPAIAFVVTGATAAVILIGGVAVSATRATANPATGWLFGQVAIFAAAVGLAATRPARARWRPAVAACLVILLGATHFSKSRLRAAEDFFFLQRGMVFKKAASWLIHEAPAGSVVATTSGWIMDYYLPAERFKLVDVGSMNVVDADDLARRLSRRAVRHGAGAFVIVDSLTCERPSFEPPSAGARIIRPLYLGEVSPHYRLRATVRAPGEVIYIYEAE